ncbi:hypothetical protein E3G56_003055 [Mycobacteroides abscessus]|nr:hypothetical protein [Mycobacteroides abscessus]
MAPLLLSRFGRSRRVTAGVPFLRCDPNSPGWSQALPMNAMPYGGSVITASTLLSGNIRAERYPRFQSYP